jgi:hypothetical protein
VLLLADVVDQAEALSGLSSSAPITIAALYVLAGAATVTGALSPLIDRVLEGSPHDRRRPAQPGHPDRHPRRRPTRARHLTSRGPSGAPGSGGAGL